MFLPAGDLLNLPAPAQGATLHILSIGVEKYERASLLPLQFAAQDAESFGAILAAQGRDSYAAVALKVLTNDKARRAAIIAAFEALTKEVRPQDVTVIFLAGHGVNHRKTRAYYFAPFDLDEDTYSRSAIEGELICRALWNAPGRRLLIVDTCNAGNVASELEQGEGAGFELHSTLLREIGTTRRRARVDLSEASSLAVLMATGRDGAAVESERWEGGAFTRALLEGLQGGGENGTGVVSLRSLCSYVRNRVRTLTRNQQEPRFAVAGGSEEDYEILRLSAERTKPALRSGDALIGKSICGFRILARIEQTPRHVLYSGMSESAPQSAIQLRALSSELSRSPAEVQRFRLSARLLRQLKSPYFVTVHEMGKLPDGRAHVIFGAAGRRRLRDVLQCGPLPAPAAARLLRFVAAALGTAHRAGVLYFSLSPSRVLIDEDLEQFQLYEGENVCLAEEPIAPPCRPPDDPLLDEMDSAHYRAPECDDPGARLSAQVDVYALGALAFHALTGRAPYSGETVGQLRSARRKQPLPVLDLDAPGLGAYTELIQRMLALDPQERPSVAEIESCLRCLDGAADASVQVPALQRTDLQGAPSSRPSGAAEATQAVTVRLPLNGVDPGGEVPLSPQAALPLPLLQVQDEPVTAPETLIRPQVSAPKPALWFQRPASYALALSGGLLMLIAASVFALRLLEGTAGRGPGAPLPSKKLSERAVPKVARAMQRAPVDPGASPGLDPRVL